MKIIEKELLTILLLRNHRILTKKKKKISKSSFSPSQTPVYIKEKKVNIHELLRLTFLLINYFL
jgi:hypothetical protein